MPIRAFTHAGTCQRLQYTRACHYGSCTRRDLIQPGNGRFEVPVFRSVTYLPVTLWQHRRLLACQACLSTGPRLVNRTYSVHRKYRRANQGSRPGSPAGETSLECPRLETRFRRTLGAGSNTGAAWALPIQGTAGLHDISQRSTSVDRNRLLPYPILKTSLFRSDWENTQQVLTGNLLLRTASRCSLCRIKNAPLPNCAETFQSGVVGCLART